MPEERAAYVVPGDLPRTEPERIRLAVELLGLPEEYADKITLLAEKNYRTVRDQLRWMIDLAHLER